MKSVMKKLFSLLLVGVVTVSMFGVIKPNYVEAVEANGLFGEKIIVTSCIDITRGLEVTTSKRGGKGKFFIVSADKPTKRKVPLWQYSFKTWRVDEIRIEFRICDPSNPRYELAIGAVFCKSSVSSHYIKNPDNSISIKIDKNAKLSADCFNGWQHKSSFFAKNI